MKSTSTTNSRRILLILLLVNFLSATVLYAQTPVTGITDYVIWGGASSSLQQGQTAPASPGLGVQVGNSSIRGGSIGSYTLVKSVGNMIAGTSTNITNIFSGGTVVLANSNVVTGKITAANNITPAAGTVFSAGTSENFSGNIDINGNIVIGGGTVSGIVTNPSSTTYTLGTNTKAGTGTPKLPILPPVMPVITAFPPATTTNITSGPIGPGNYGTLSIGGNTTVTLNGPGVYVFKSITATGPNSKLVFNFSSTTTGNFLIYVYGDVILNRLSCSIIGGSATRIFTEVQGKGLTNTSDGTVAFSMSNGSNGNGNTSSWFGSVWVPYAGIKIGTPNGPAMAVQGALWSGTQVNIQDGVTIVYAPATVNTCLTPAITAQPAPPAATCTGSGIRTISVTATGTGLTYSWRKGGSAVTNAGAISGQGTSTLTFTNPTNSDAGNYDVLVGGSCGTTTSNTVSVTVNALPVVTAVSQVCIGSTITLSPTTGGTWTSSDNTKATVTNAGVVTGVAAGTATFKFTNSTTTCSATTSSVTINALPVVSAVSQVCIGSTITLSPTTGGTWTSSDNTKATVTNAGVVTGVAAGTATFKFTNSTTTCSATTSSVTINALPLVSAAASVCVASTITLSPTTGGTWTSSNILFATVTDAGVVTGVADGSVTFAFTQTSTGCSNTTSSVKVNALPAIVDAAGPDKPYNFDGITTIGKSDLTGFTFKWTAPIGGLISTADNQASINVEAPGIYKLDLRSAVGCTSTDEVLVSNKVNKLIGSELTSIYWNNPTGLPSPFFIIKDGYVRIDIIVKISNYDYVLNLLQQTTPISYGLINIVTNGENGLGEKEIVITGDYPIINLLKLNELYDYINYCRPFYEAISNSGGLVTSAGDTTMRSNLVRSGYKIDGAGIKVGIISNSFATITSATTPTLPLQPITTPTNPIAQTFITNTAAQDLSNGDISAVTVLQDYPIRSTDEGRAMAQIVHDVAPGAQLYFRTGYFTAGDFATGIKQLAAAGCKVIVDDLSYFTEPFLKDGVVAKAVDYVKAQGVTYFSSAGNFGNKSYEKDFAPVDAALAGFAGLKAHDFGGGDIFQRITLAPGNYTIVLQWVDNIYSNGELQGTNYDIDMYWRSNSGNGTSLKGFNRDNKNGDPVEILPFTINTTTDADFLIVNNTTTGNPARIKYVIYRGDVQILEYNEGSSTVVGQANAAGAIAVGASRYDKAPPYLTVPLIESFSSVGGTKTEGEVRYKPEIVGPDGVNTTVKMGQDYPNSALDGYSNFFGTSAAAPHAAAVAALIMQGKKKFLDQDVSLSTPDQIKYLLQLTAVDMEAARNLTATSKFDFISGYGLVDADSAMRTFAAPTATLIDVVVPAGIKPCSGVSFTVTITGENFSRNTVVYLIKGPGDSTIIIPTFINSGAVSVTVSSCIGNPELKAYTAPKSGTNGKDGGFSNSKYFFSAYVTVDAVSINKKYGETLVIPDKIIRVNGKLLQDTTVTLQDIGLASMTVTTAATSISDVGTYAINVTRIFDPTNVADVEFQKNYNYKFTDGTVTIAKMPLRVTPDNKTITYGKNLGKVTFKYDFNKSNVADPVALETIIRNYHEAYLPGNALAVIKDFKKQQINGTILDFTKLLNMNMVASFNAVNNSRKFTLSNNNTLVPITDAAVLRNNLNVQYLVDVASESIYNYSLNSSTARFFSAYPGIKAKALLGAASLSSDDINSGLVELPVQNMPGIILTSKVLSGTLAQTVSGTGGPLVPIVGGSLVQITDAEIITDPPSTDLAQYINGEWFIIVSDASGTISLNKVVNRILRGANGLTITVDGSGSSLVTLPGGTTNRILTNAILRGANGTDEILVTVVNGSDVPVPDGSLIEMDNGDLVQFTVSTFSFNVISNGIILRGANGAILRGANGAILRGPNGAILRGANGAILRGANGAILRGANGAILRGANGIALGADAADNNTGVILDSDDATNDGTGYAWLGSMFGVNMITGLDIGKQYLVPGVLVDPNFDISYGLGEVDITKAQITVTAAPNSKIYDGTTSAAAIPTITAGSLSGGDIAVFNETYDDKNQGSSKTMTPAVVSIVDALGVSVAANYTVMLTNSNNGVISKRDLTVTAVTNTKTYDGVINAAALPAITTGSLAGVDVTVFKETYENKNQGTGKTMTPTVVSIVDALNVSMMVNYNVTLNSSNNGVINKRDIIVTAAANTKTYNGALSATALPTITAGTLASGDIAVFSETYDNKNQGTGKTLTPAVVSIVDALNTSMVANYNVALTNSTNGVINKAPLTVRADDKTRKYGENNPVLTVSYSGFVNGEDSISSGIKGMNGTGIPSAITTATQYSPVSPPTYPITTGIGTLSPSSNYAYSFVNGALTVTSNQCLITHDATKFVSTSNPGTATSLWLNITVKVSGQLVADGDYLIFRAGDITLNSVISNLTVTNLAIPNGKIIADNGVSSPITNFDAATNTWITKVPVGYASTSDIFVSGAIINSSNGFAARNSKANSVVKGMFYSNKSFSDQWSYAMGAYQPQFAYSAIAAPGAVTAINGTYRAGTPATVIAYIVGGGTGNGGSNYTGSSSNQNAFTACIPAGSSVVNRAITSTASLGAIIREVLISKDKMDVNPNPASNNVRLSFVPATTGIAKITLLTIDGKRVIEINNGVSEAGKNYVRNIDVSNLVAGVYIIQLNTGYKITIKKVIITR